MIYIYQIVSLSLLVGITHKFSTIFRCRYNYRFLTSANKVFVRLVFFANDYVVFTLFIFSADSQILDTVVAPSKFA